MGVLKKVNQPDEEKKQGKLVKISPESAPRSFGTGGTPAQMKPPSNPQTSGGTSTAGWVDALFSLPGKAVDAVKNADRQTLLEKRNTLEARRDALRSANVGGIGTFSHANDSNATRIRELDDEIASVDRFLNLQNQIELQPYKQKVTPAREALSKHSIQTNLARRSRGFTYEDAQLANEKASELRREVEKKQRGVEGIKYKQGYQDITRDGSFIGQFSANYDVGQMGEDEALAWNTYLNDPTEENRIYAESVSAAREAYMARNQEALEADTGNSWISKDLAGYLPQFLGQNIAGIKGGIGGGAVGTVVPLFGTATGLKAGYTAGRALYGYETARGRVFKSLLDAGVPEDQARLAANDEAIVSSVIEGGDAVIDMLTLGFGNLLKKGGTAAAKSTLPKILRNYGINIGSEGLQEWTQEGVSIANQKRNDTGILNLVQESAGQMGRAISGQDPEALEQMNQAGLTGLKIAAMMGGGGIAFNTALSKATSPLMLPTADQAQEGGYSKITEQDAINQFNQNVNNRTAFVPDNPLVNMLPTVSEAMYYAPGSPAYRGAQSAWIQKEKNRPAIPDAGASAGPEGNAQSALPQGPSKSIILPGGQEVNQQVGPESSVGAARKGFDPYSAFLGTKSDFLPEGADAARPVDVPTTDAQGNPIRKTAATAMGAKAIPDEVVGDIQSMIMSGDLSYKRVTDRDSINRAVSRIKADGFQRSLGDFSDAVQKGVVSKDLATLGQQLLVNAANAGDVNSTAELLSLYAQMETVAGQAVQAASILRKLSPTAQLYAAQKVASNLEKTLSKQLKGKSITINPDLITEFNEQTDQEGRDAVMEKIYKNLADQVPSTWRDKWNAWRYLAMLGNPRTHIRNIVGNVGFQPVRWTKDRLAAAIEAGVSGTLNLSQKALNRFGANVTVPTLNRTKSFAYNPALYAAAWNDFKSVKDVLSGSKYDDVQSIINDNRTIFRFKPLEALRKGNTGLLGAEDMVFKRVTYADALSGYLAANGVTAEQLKSGSVDPALMSAARDYAGQEALKATYNDRNVVSDRVVQIARPLGMFGEAILPFKRTPANILVRGAEYSPLGLVKGIYDGIRRNKSGAQVIDEIASGLTGTVLMALGGLLAAAGVVSGGAGDDDKQAGFDQLTGAQTYALNLPGGGSVTLDWLAPEALPFFMGVQLVNIGGEEGLTPETILSSLSSISEPMLEMSMLQSLNDLIDNVSFAASNEKLQGLVWSSLVSYFTQAIPTLGGQIERSSEDVRMSTYTDKNSLIPVDAQYALGKASAKIPVWDFQQIPFIDEWGRTEENAPLSLRVFNNFLNPAYTSQRNVTPLDEEIQRIYDETGEGGVIPSRAPKYLTIDGERIDLTADQYVRYATKRGQLSHEIGSDMIRKSAFSGLTDEQKAKVLSEVYTYADSIAKMSVSSYTPPKWIQKVVSSGVDPATAILYHESEADTETKRRMLMNDNTLTPEEKSAIDKALFNDGMFIPKEVDVDYSSEEAFTITQLSDAGQKKWEAAQRWGMPYEDYVKYYPICSKSGKGMTKAVVIQNLIDAGMSQRDAYNFWDLIRNG